MEWLSDASCRSMHAHFWYPPLESPTPNNYYTVGKMVCFRCPVWKDCLDASTKNAETWGMWGGLTPQERKGTAKVPHGTPEKYRLGCWCADCREASVRIHNKVDLSVIPRVGEDFDISEVIFNTSGD